MCKEVVRRESDIVRKIILGIVLFVTLYLPSIVSAEELTSIQWFDKGYAYQQSKSYNEAIWAYTEAIKLNPKFSLAYNNRGDMYLFTQQFPLAFDDHCKAIELGSQIPSAFLYRGAYYLSKNVDELAISDYNKAIELEPKYGLAYFYRFLLYAEAKRYDLALADIDKAITLAPFEIIPSFSDVPSADIPSERLLSALYTAKGGTCEKLGLVTEAIESYKICLEYANFDLGRTKAETTQIKKFLTDKIKKLGGSV